MKISTKGRYGLRAIVDLAAHSHGDHVALKSIAQRQDISEGYLEQVFSSLRKGGLIKSVKGPQGGYMLARDASEITVGDVLRILEGELSVAVETAEEGSVNEIECCLADNVWRKVNDSINSTVDGITLDDLVEEYNKIKNDDSFIYYI